MIHHNRLYKGVDFMAVPADIRAVKRPINTIVDDSGRDGPKRYAVRERSGAKYVQGDNPQPRNGKVVDHVIDHVSWILRFTWRGVQKCLK